MERHHWIAIGVSGLIVLWLCILIWHRLQDARKEKVRKLCPDGYEVLYSYLKTKRPDYALMLDGAWGIGKTYFINKFIQSCGILGLPWETPLYVSLYGVSSSEEIEKETLKALYFRKIHGVIYIAASILTVLAFSGGLTWCCWKLLALSVKGIEIKEFLPWFWPIYLIVITVTWRGFKHYIFRLLLVGRSIIFDDFERINMDVENALAHINRFVEHLHKHVVIVGNERELLLKHINEIPSPDQESNNNSNEIFPKKTEELKDNQNLQYKKIKEKVIGEHFTFQKHSDREVMRAIFTQGATKGDFPLLSMLFSDDLAIDWFIEYTSPKGIEINLRIWKHCCQKFERIFRKINKDLLTKKKIWEKLIPDFFAAFYAFQQKDFGDNKIFDTDIATPDYFNSESRKWFFATFPYHDFLTEILPYSWKELLNGKFVDCDYINFFWTQNLGLNPALWEKFYEYRQQDDDTCIKIWNELKCEYQKRTITNPKEILNIFGSILEMIDEGFCPDKTMTKEKAFRWGNCYLHKVTLCDDCLDIRYVRAFYSHPNIDGLVSHCSNDQLYEKFHDALNNTINDFRISNIPKQYEDFLKILASDNQEFEKQWGTLTAGEYEFFAGQDPQKLISVFKGLKFEDFMERVVRFSSLLNERAIINSKNHDYWTDLLVLLDKTAQDNDLKWQLAQKWRLNELADNIKENLSDFDEQQHSNKKQ